MRLGETLRLARERKGITLDQASEDTRIREKFLRALEADDAQSLPGAVYTRGFLRNYGEYLGLDVDALVGAFESERPIAEAPQRLEPIKPIERRALIFTPKLVVPAVIAAGVVVFVGWLYFQFTSFAVPPRLAIEDPAAEALVQTSDFVLRGRTVPEAKISVTVYPGPDRYTDIRPSADGRFAVPIHLKPGPNHVEVEVLDTSGKVNSATRVIRFDTSIAAQQGPQLIVEQPSNGASYTDGPVTVTGRVDPSVAVVLVNGTPVQPTSDGRFVTAISFAPGQQSVRVVARTAAGAEVDEQRSVAVTYTRAVVFVQIRGGSAWLLAVVDGAQDARTNTVFADGTTLTFVGKQVIVRSGNAGVTYLTYNGQSVGVMGAGGQVAERTFATP